MILSFSRIHCWIFLPASARLSPLTSRILIHLGIEPRRTQTNPVKRETPNNAKGAELQGKRAMTTE